jgi:hypothetical protein
MHRSTNLRTEFTSSPQIPYDASVLTRRRLTVFTFALFCLGALLPGTAPARIVRSLSPHSSMRGHHFSFESTGLKPGMHVSPFVLATSVGSCCGVGIRQTKVVPPSGRVRFSFLWPPFFYRCVKHGGRHCVRANWKAKMKLRIGVSAPEMYRFPKRRKQHSRMHRQRRSRLFSAPFAQSAAARPPDPLVTRGMRYTACNSIWMTEAGTIGAGVGADVSYAPTQKTRLLGRFFGDDIWLALQRCAPFPYLTNNQYESIYQQFVCHLEGGVSGIITGPTYDFQAWRPVVPAHTSLVDDQCSPSLGSGGGLQYLGQIIQWSADPNHQRAAWLVSRTGSGQLQRRWIPTTEIYGCLKSRGTRGPTELDHDFIAEYLRPEGPDVSQAEACSGSPVMPTPSPAPIVLPAHEFHVMNASGGIYWRSSPDWNTPVATSGNGFYPDTVIRVNCYRSGAANVPGTLDGMWEQAAWVSGQGSGSGWINEHFIDDGAAINQPSPGTAPCATPSPPPPPPPPPPPHTWAEQETPNHPVNTFTNYHNASGMGPAIAAGQWVQVTCKVYDPFIASVNPDGYWYRIASSPWNNAYYSPANTFMNGDPYGGPYTHNTDFSVPNC